jgi:hypothetical protein
VPRNSNVVDEDVEARELARRIRDRPFRLAWLREIRDDVRDLAHIRCLASPARDHSSILGNEQPYRLEPDPARRARHEALLPCEFEVQGAASVSAC